MLIYQYTLLIGYYSFIWVPFTAKLRLLLFMLGLAKLQKCDLDRWKTSAVDPRTLELTNSFSTSQAGLFMMASR